MAKGGGKLADRHKRFLVLRIACFDTPKEAADALKEAYGIEVTPQSAEHYDATKYAGATLAKPLVALFEATRKEFLAKTDAIPIANPAVRLQRLERICQAALARGNHVLAASIMEQAAKERGGAFTNRRELTGKDGGPVKYQDTSDMTDDQIDQELARHLGLEAAVVVPSTPPKTH